MDQAMDGAFPRPFTLDDLFFPVLSAVERVWRPPGGHGLMFLLSALSARSCGLIRVRLGADTFRGTVSTPELCLPTLCPFILVYSACLSSFVGNNVFHLGYQIMKSVVLMLGCEHTFSSSGLLVGASHLQEPPMCSRETSLVAPLLSPLLGVCWAGGTCLPSDRASVSACSWVSCRCDMGPVLGPGTFQGAAGFFIFLHVNQFPMCSQARHAAFP